MGTGSRGARRSWSGQSWEGSEQGMVELGLVFSTYPFGLECSGNSSGARMKSRDSRGGRLLLFPRDVVITGMGLVRSGWVPDTV